MSAPILDHLNALGDETRVRILALLDGSEFSVGELSTVLQLAQPTVSRHLKTLAEEGWVDVRQDGRSRHYRVSPDLDDGARELWQIVRARLGEDGPYTSDAERAAAVLRDRQLRSDEFFARAAERWDDMREELFGRGVRFAPLLGLLDSGWTVGDLGTGTGALARVIAPFVQRVVGIDRSSEMLSAAEHRLEDIENVELRPGALEALPIEDGELDVALLSLVLHYVVDPPQVLSEVYRTLRPGGRAVVLEMREHERGVGYADEMGHVWPGFEPAQIERWLNETGFDEIRTHKLAPDPSASGPMLFLTSARRGGASNRSNHREDTPERKNPA
ncbi:MAG: metalloregulator ArsR/SmtB family transcription factor [Gemmatimonadota bacterium]|nr:metalloregulator ArsR/SmtB family transcription factor [Gemmatimonadota bacterium]